MRSAVWDNNDDRIALLRIVAKIKDTQGVTHNLLNAIGLTSIGEYRQYQNPTLNLTNGVYYYTGALSDKISFTSGVIDYVDVDKAYPMRVVVFKVEINAVIKISVNTGYSHLYRCKI